MNPDATAPPVKRYRRDETADPTNPNPSVVIHVRNLNPKATEADLLEALSHFGLIAYATVMPTKRMALVEFEDIECARKCVVFAQTAAINVAGYPALFNYSTSEAIQRIGLESEHPNRILCLTIYNAHYAITVDVIHQISSPHGNILKIAMIKRNMVQALVEYDSIESARKAKHAMNGADIYSGCCTLKVEFAKVDHVKVTRNDQDQWDYTLKDPSTSRRALLTNERRPLTTAGIPSRGPTNGPAYPSYDDYSSPAYPASYRSYPERAPAYPDRGPAYPERASDAAYPPRYPDDRTEYGGLTFSRNGRQLSTADPYAMHSERAKHESQVLMIYGVNHENFNCERIFNLFCGFGNVNKVRFIRKKPDTCMIEMSVPVDVTNALKYLQGAKAFGCTFTLRPSKQPTLRDIFDPFDMPDGTPSYADFSRSRNHRFTTPQMAVKNRLAKPSNQLHWYNTPTTMTEERLKQLFMDTKCSEPTSITLFTTKSERSTSGLVEFKNAEAATEAMMLANHVPIQEEGAKTPFIFKMSFSSNK